MGIEILQGVSTALNAAFGEEYTIYQNDGDPELRKPCFLIGVLKPEISPMLGNREIRRYPLEIQYVPSDSGNRVEMLAAAEKMVEALRLLTLPNGDLLRGTGISYEVVDKVLHFFVNYNLPVIRAAEKTAMETLETEVGIQNKADDSSAFLFGKVR